MTAVPLKHRTAFPPPAETPSAAQFAALPWRRLADGSVKVLLITSRETRRWVIPKGWPMPDRTPAQAAAQEAYEEAGVVGTPAERPIGAYAYDKRLRDGERQTIEVSVFPLEVFVEQLAFPEHAQREKLWTSPAEAAERVDEPELKALIRRFRAPKPPKT
jgi:8-oxo-dGTP pyrophosphatase MutT (NUDIX family)